MWGQIGSGKTTLAIQELCGRIAREPERIIATNIDVLPAFVELCGGLYPVGRLILLDSSEKVRKFYKYTPAGTLVYIDEAMDHFDSRRVAENKKENPDLFRYLTHVRKYRDDVTFLCQEEDHLDKRIRDLVTLVTVCVSIRTILIGASFPFAKLLPEFFMVRDYLGVGCKGHAKTYWVRSSPYYWTLFDSYAVGTAADLERLAVSRAMVPGKAVSVASLRPGFDTKMRLAAGLGAAAAAGFAGFWL